MTTYSPEPQLLDTWLEVGCPASCDLGGLNRTGSRALRLSFPSLFPLITTPPSAVLNCFLGQDWLAFSFPSCGEEGVAALVAFGGHGAQEGGAWGALLGASGGRGVGDCCGARVPPSGGLGH